MATTSSSDELQQLVHELQTSDAYRIKLRFDVLDNSYYIFYRNLEGLLKLLAGPGEEHVLFVAKMAGDYAWSVWVLREFMRRLHNFCASAMMLVEHVRPLIRKKWYARTALCDEYDAHIDADFQADGLHHFIKNLRHYVLHNSTPPAGLHIGWHWSPQEVHFDVTFTLGREDLLRWDGWSNEARSFIETCEENIKVKDLVTAYATKVNHLQVWLYERMQEEHSADLAYVAVTQDRIQQLHEEVYGPPPHHDIRP